MDNKLENELYNIDPLFFKDAIECENGSLNEMQTCMAFGCECDNGWFEPLKKFVKKVKLLNTLASKYNFYFVCDQLKEKFGTLRIYWSTRSLDSNIKVSNEKNSEIDSLADLFDDALIQCEKECNKTCELCGAKESYSNNTKIICTDGWIKYICDKCSRELIENSAKDIAEFKQEKYIPLISNFNEGYYFLNPFYDKKYFVFNKIYYNNIFLAYLNTLLKDKSNNSLFLKEVLNNPFISYCYINENYESLDYNLLENIIYEYYNSNKDFKDLLLETNDKKLIWNNSLHDNNLGNCTCEKCRDINGLNHYGIILENVRKKLREETKNEK